MLVVLNSGCLENECMIGVIDNIVCVLLLWAGTVSAEMRASKMPLPKEEAECRTYLHTESQMVTDGSATHSEISC